MTRVKAGVRRRQKHKKILKQAKGYHSARRKLFKKANETVLKSGEYAFAGRRLRRRDARQLWIIKINAAARELGITYSKLIKSLKDKNIKLDRKSLATLAQNKESFKRVVS